ncbi:MAG: TetR/AcrR family transcriptional regulator [Actinomycetota bacterium]|nr:TetR/AcrR family transcriptional regulator [Actinomycetota bacterium]
MAATSPTTLTDGHDPRIARSRARIVAAATELFVEGGPRAVTVDAVAERSGVAKSTLYRHWGSVNELLVDVMRANVPDPTQVDLAAGFEPALRWWIGHAVATLSAPEWTRTLPVLLEMRSQSPEMAQLLDADFDGQLVTIAAILEVGAIEGRLPAGLDPRLVTQALVGPLVLAALTGDEPRVAELAEYVLDRFLASYRPPGDPR